MSIAQDKDGFESVDSYFPEDDLENTTNRHSSNKKTWTVQASGADDMDDEHDVQVRFGDEDDDEYHNTDNLMDGEPQYDDGVGMEPMYNHDDHIVDEEEDEEIVLSKTIKARPSLSPIHTERTKKRDDDDKKAQSKSKPIRLTRKRSLLPDPLVPIDHDDHENDGDTRKSNRKRFAPLAFWRNEKVVYGRRNSASTDLMSIIHHDHLIMVMVIV